ncbi:MAG: DUF4364 domain-containing protein [Thermoplasmatales archaeon]|nr:MAG: DUF4364 domain-containing protein [Thermoplasmatales archaeon]
MMFSKRRSEIEIIGNILDLSKKGAKKTEILYQSNMNFSQLQNYLAFLIEKNFVEEETIENENGTTRKIYVTTEKGNNLLEDITNLYTHFE